MRLHRTSAPAGFDVSAGEKQDAEAQLAEDDRVDDQLSLGARQPVDDARVGVRFGCFGENVRVDQGAHKPRCSEGVGRFRLYGREPVGRRTRAQSVDDPAVRWWRDPGEPAFAGSDALDVELFSRLDVIGFAQLRGQDNLALC